MLSALSGLQFLIIVAIGLVALGMEGYALVDALRQRADAFTAAGKLTKNKWIGILGVALALGILALPFSPAISTLGFLSLAGVVASGVYLADVRPALRRMTGGGNRRW
jgi:Protein of unknown function (DUF2516)